MEFIFEFLLEFYMELMFLIVPKEKTGTKKYRIFCTILAIAVCLGTLGLFLWGCTLVSDNNNLGIILIVLSVMVSLVQIILGFIMYKKENDE